MDLKKYNNLLTSGRWSTKDSKYDQILDLVGVAHNIADDSNNVSEKSNRDSTKGGPAYIKDIPPKMLEKPKSGEGGEPRLVNKQENHYAIIEMIA